jgi:hypothetical protein
MARNYLKWNKALVNHFFNEKNDQKEVILYADKDLISQIGLLNNLGDYNDFLNSILIDLNKKISIYDSIVSASGKSRTVEINRALQKSIFEFPNTLLDIKYKRSDLIYFNYIIFYITVFVSDQESSFYNHLNTVINKYLQGTIRVSSLKGLDSLFEQLENWSFQNKLGVFRARRIGALAYKGLLNYQVVLKPEEYHEFEKILYTYGVYINENTIYPELVNKLLPFTNNIKLRHKLIEGIKKTVYAEWFLNRALQFDHDDFSKTELGESIKIERKALLAFNINSEYKLELLTDALLNKNDETTGFQIESSGINSYGFYEAPLITKKEIKFEEQIYTTKNNTLTLKNVPIRGVNFFQKNGNDYIQRLVPDANYECIVVVDKNESRWLNWSNNDKNIDDCKLINTEILNSIFGDSFIFYHAKNIKKPYYKNSEDIYTTSSHNEELRIKKLGGLRVNNNNNLYLDVALPYFKVESLDSEEFGLIDVTPLRNGIKDKGISVTRDKQNETFYLYINGETIIEESSLVIVKFHKGRYEKSFDFSIAGSNLENNLEKKFFKYDTWGDYNTDCKTFFQGTKIIGKERVQLNTNKHSLTDLIDENSFDKNYLIYLLVGISANLKVDYLRYKDLIKAIDVTLVYFKSKGVLISEGKYSRFQLISNLIGLGYLNYRINELEEKEFQLMPFGIKKIEKSFNRNSQVYQVTGTYSRLVLDKLKLFCSENKIEIKYKSVEVKENILLQKIMQPDIIYIDLKNKVQALVEFFKEEFKLNLLIEDTYHLGDSLLNFIGSLNDFENEHLNDNVPLNNQNLIFNPEEGFPRIVKTEENYKRHGRYYSKKFLEKSEGNFFKIKHLYWANLYIQNKKSKPIVFTKRTYGQSQYNYSKEILIPSRIFLPEIIYAAFCNLNHGIPLTKKVFWKNTPKDSLFTKHTFSYFDQYFISDKPKRRENISRILTGSIDLDTNPQIKYLQTDHSKYILKYIKCSLLSDFKSGLLITDNDQNIIGLYVYKVLYVNSKYTQIPGSNCLSLVIKDIEQIKLSKVDSTEMSENEQISNLLDGNFDQFKFKKSAKILNADIVEEEKIEIRELK